METHLPQPGSDVVSDFKVFHDLMAFKVREILLVSSPYDAFLMEEDGSLAARIISEYRGLNLSQPPRIERVSAGGDCLQRLTERSYDLVVTMPQVGDMDGFALGRRIKKQHPGLPVVLLTHSLRAIRDDREKLAESGIDNVYVWAVDPDLLLAIVKNVEDHKNVDRDTKRAWVRVLILVEDSPLYRSHFLPLIYRAVVRQTQAVLDESLNEEHRLLKMRARPKILLAENFEQAMQLYHRFQPYVFGIISDTRFPRQKRLDDRAGLELLRHIRREIPDLPLLLLSSESGNREQAEAIPAVFLDKNDPDVHEEINDFFLQHLGFGDFVFRLPDGTEVGRAKDLADFEKKIPLVPEESLIYHGERNHFSNWLMARSEVGVASMLRELKVSDFGDIKEMKEFLITCVHDLRTARQQGVIARFSAQGFDAETMDFVKVGAGSLGGKARGLAFMAHLLAREAGVHAESGMRLLMPKTLVIGSDGFDSFVAHNRLRFEPGLDDRTIAGLFLAGEIPDWLERDLAVYLEQTRTPLSVRSSSLLEDAQYKPYAGLYKTIMLPNNHPDFAVRLGQLLQAVKLVYASTWFAGPRAFSLRGQQTEADGMAVIVQRLAGRQYGDYYYPALSGVAQSHNFYPVSGMKPEEGIAHIALGFGKTVMEGEKSVRFSPVYPKVLPQFSSVDDILANVQRTFYALSLKDYAADLALAPDANLVRRDVDAAGDEEPVRALASTYFPEEHRVRDGAHKGQKVLTFARLLKYHHPLPAMLSRLLAIGAKGMGAAVEIEFAMDINADASQNDFYFLQIRPMVIGGERLDVAITRQEIDRAFCYSTQALGHGRSEDIADIVYVNPLTFDAAATREIARQISAMNRQLIADNRPYLLAGPGRWGSADRWLGVPVEWEDISGVGVIVELRNEQLKVDPSQGTHFFHNITALAIPYITVTEGSDKWEWARLAGRNAFAETKYLRHLRLERPLVVKVDGKSSRCVMLEQ